MAAPAGPGVASRLAAWRAVRRVHQAGAWASPAVAGALEGQGLDARDRAFAANLAFQTLRWEGTLDWAVAQVSSRPLTEVDEELLDVLRLGAWQLLYSDLPDRAAVATAVDVARAVSGERVAGFTNGVLRALARRRATLPWPPAAHDEGLALRLGYPVWVVAEARRRFGERAEAVLAAGNEPPGLTLRAVDGREALLAELAGQGYEAQRGEHTPEAVRVAASGDPARVPAVAAGRATPQDEASMLVARVLAERISHGLDESRILDTCAAPGGKATHVAQLGAFVVAADLRPRRVRLVAELADRLGLADRIAVIAADGTRPPWPPDAFDAALVDVPCTGLGVTRRRPELRWRRDPADPARLGRLQLALLEAAARSVRPGGTVVYSACTWTEAETRDVAQAFLAACGDRFTVDTAPLPAGGRLDDDPGTQLAPDRDGVDGMYVAVFTNTPGA